KNYVAELSSHLKTLFYTKWESKRNELDKLNLTQEELQHYFQDSLLMLANWLNSTIQKINQRMQTESFEDAFFYVKPDLIEQKFVSDKYKVMGFIDYIMLKDDKIKIMDYKTSKSAELKPEYKLQLGIYALLFLERYGKMPDEVGLWVLKHGEVTLPVTEQLIKDAKFEVEQIHLATESENIEDYPKKQSPLCKWSTGQCEFYEKCFNLES
ncbi:Dna2/Cas4 domain-containing protein, partial [Candidatus Woesearchaeota archaeon]